MECVTNTYSTPLLLSDRYRVGMFLCYNAVTNVSKEEPDRSRKISLFMHTSTTCALTINRLRSHATG